MKPLTQSSSKLKIWKNICVDFMKAYQEQEVGRMIALCDPESTVWFKPLGESGRGKIHNLGKSLWSDLIQSFPDIDNTVHSIVAEEGTIRCNVSIRGSQAQEFAGIPNKGGSFDSEHIFVFHLDENHKISHLDIDWDHHDFVHQLASASDKY
jgi:predicted ester cyclase